MNVMQCMKGVSVPFSGSVSSFLQVWQYQETWLMPPYTPSPRVTGRIQTGYSSSTHGDTKI